MQELAQRLPGPKDSHERDRCSEESGLSEQEKEFLGVLNEILNYDSDDLV
jgi:hypothetical protein